MKNGKGWYFRFDDDGDDDDNDGDTVVIAAAAAAAVAAAAAAAADDDNDDDDGKMSCKWVSWTRKTQYVAKKTKKATVKTDYMIDTLSTKYIHENLLTSLNLSPYVFNAYEQPCIMMRGRCMRKTNMILRSLCVLILAHIIDCIIW